MKALRIGTGFGNRKAHEDSRSEVVSRMGSIERSYKGQEALTDICIIPTDMHEHYTQCTQVKFFQVSI